MALLSVRDLSVNFAMRRADVQALRGVSFELERGERLGVVGESGAGKSITGFAIINLLSRPGYISGGSIHFDGREISGLDARAMRGLRGNRIAMIFQDPMMTLNPVLTIGQQMVETLRAHRDISKPDAEKIAIDRLRAVQIPSPEARLAQYPHELSGGMRQRVIIAIALLLEPELIIADEPTTALDVTIQAEIMELLLELCRAREVGLMLITHDLAVVAQMTQRTMVMYAGRVIELGATRAIIDHPSHPYTAGLIAALPQQTPPGERLRQIPGAMPGLAEIPQGCAFHPRCPHAEPRCRETVPPLAPAAGASVACLRAEALRERGALKEVLA